MAVALREADLDVALQPGRPSRSTHATAIGGRRPRVRRRVGCERGGGRGAVAEGTHTVAFRAELERKWGVLTGGVQYDAYRNDVARLLVDNPFRATDATAPGAQLGPNDTTTAGARQAEIGLAPDNDAFTATAGAAVRLPLRTRVTALPPCARTNAT